MRHWRAQGGAVGNDVLATGGEPRLEFDDEARELGARIFYLRYGRRDLASFVAGYRRILRKAFDALHDHQDYVSGWHYLMGLGALPPIRVTHVHNPAYRSATTTASRWPAGWLPAGERLTSWQATHVVGAGARRSPPTASMGRRSRRLRLRPSTAASTGAASSPVPRRGPRRETSSAGPRTASWCSPAGSTSRPI